DKPVHHRELERHKLHVRRERKPERLQKCHDTHVQRDTIEKVIVVNIHHDVPGVLRADARERSKESDLRVSPLLAEEESLRRFRSTEPLDVVKATEKVVGFPVWHADPGSSAHITDLSISELWIKCGESRVCYAAIVVLIV